MFNKFPIKLNQIQNLQKILKTQFARFNQLRELAKNLQFHPVESSGIYSPISFAAFDGGMMGLEYYPFELEFIEIANSFEQSAAKFLLPKQTEIAEEDLSYIDDISEIREFKSHLGVDSIDKLFNFPPDTSAIMNLAELACIINMVVENKNQPYLIMKDGFLRTKYLKTPYKMKIIEILKKNSQQKVIGVAKRSKIVNLFSTALNSEQIIPTNQVGFIEIPQNLEFLAYKWSQNTKEYPMGKIYIAKLSKNSPLLVSVEIPYDFSQNRPIYSIEEIYHIFGCLVKDSQFSFPNIGYPQTIMRAHEQAVRTGFTASIWRDFIKEELLKVAEDDSSMVELMREAWYMGSKIQKEFLGGL